MYERPHNLDQALSALSSGQWAILAGGTDFFPMLGDIPSKKPVLDITALSELRGIVCENEYWRIGALTSWSELLEADLPEAFDGLKLAAREVGSIQIQNRATIAGNICNASPAADGVPPLMTLEAEIQLTSLKGSRRFKISEFITGYRSTALNAGELVTAIFVPKRAAVGNSSFLKLGARRYLVISIAMAAARLRLGDSGRISEANIAVGACSEVARRLSALEQELIGHEARSGFRQIVRRTHLDELSPIDDVRADASYRRDAVVELVARVLENCVKSKAGDP